MSPEPLRPFQLKAAEWMCQRSRAILGSEQGTGKTPIAIDAARRVGGRDFLICGASLQKKWRKDIFRFSGVAEVQIIKKSTEPFDPGALWFISTFEQFRRMTALGREMPPGLSSVIVDESHNLTNLRAGRTKAILGKTSPLRNVPHFWFLTGTPFPNRLINCYPTFNFTCRGRLGKYNDFGERYCYKTEDAYSYSGYKFIGKNKAMLPELVELMRPYLYRDELKDVLKEIPEIQPIAVPLEPSPKAKKILDEWKELERRAEETTDDNELEYDENFSQAYRELGLLKVEDVAEFAISTFEDADSPVAIFGHHPAVLRNIAGQLFDSGGYSVAVIDGGTSKSARARFCDQFQAGDLNFILCSDVAASEGIDLQRSHIMIFAEEPLTPNRKLQAMSRIRRMGTTKPCIYYFCQFPGTLDTAIHRSVKRRETDIRDFWAEFKGINWGSGDVDESEEIDWD
jgi:SNF2 family DNA or RNA helicase